MNRDKFEVNNNAKENEINIQATWPNKFGQ